MSSELSPQQIIRIQDCHGSMPPHNRADADSQFVSNLFGPITTRQEFQNFRCLKVAVEASRQVLNNESIDLSALY